MAPIPQIDPPVFRENLNQDINLPSSWFELYYNGRTLKYTLEVIGEGPQPQDGYPLYIGMHGGGNDKTGDGNNKAWTSVGNSWYCKPVAAYHNNHGPAVLVCPRGISSGEITRDSLVDEWNLHFRPESYVLIERMIANLLQPSHPEFKASANLAKYQDLNLLNKHFIDPNKVILWSFSAGGDGAFRLGTKLSDRFAAVVAAAGHPGDTRFANIAKVVTLLEVGEDDYYDDTKTNIRFHRAEVYLRLAEKPLEELKEKFGKDHYRHVCYVVENGYRSGRIKSEKPNKVGYQHNYWSDPKMIDTKQRVLDPKPDNFTEWRNAFATFTTVPQLVHLDDNLYHEANINPVTLLKDVIRNPTPERVIWDLAWRPEKPDRDPQGWEKRFFYWLYLRKAIPDDLKEQIDKSLKDYVPEEIRYTPTSNSLHIPKANDYLGYLLKDSWLSNKISVYLGKDDRPIWSNIVQPQVKIREDTLAARGDPNFEFAAMIYLEKKTDGSWDVKQAQSLDG